jgi:hypothetical protein
LEDSKIWETDTDWGQEPLKREVEIVSSSVLSQLLVLLH